MRSSTDPLRNCRMRCRSVRTLKVVELGAVGLATCIGVLLASMLIFCRIRASISRSVCPSLRASRARSTVDGTRKYFRERPHPKAQNYGGAYAPLLEQLRQCG